MKIVSEPLKDGIPIDKMKDGEIAIVITSRFSEDWKGKIVQRYYDNLVVLGDTAGKGITDYFKNCVLPSTLRVRILKPGTILEI